MFNLHLTTRVIVEAAVNQIAQFGTLDDKAQTARALLRAAETLDPQVVKHQADADKAINEIMKFLDEGLERTKGLDHDASSPDLICLLRGQRGFFFTMKRVVRKALARVGRTDIIDENNGVRLTDATPTPKSTRYQPLKHVDMVTGPDLDYMTFPGGIQILNSTRGVVLEDGYYWLVQPGRAENDQYVIARYNSRVDKWFIPGYPVARPETIGFSVILQKLRRPELPELYLRGR